MFKLDPKWLVIGILLAGLFGYWHWTTSQLDHYKTLSERQEQTIAQQKNEIAQLKVDIAKKEQQILIERESVKKQTALEQQEKDKLSMNTSTHRKSTLCRVSKQNLPVRHTAKQ